MVADMFGGASDQVMGFVTSGGTESLMLAVRTYRNWGIKERGHQIGEGVIIASTSVHAAVLKAKEAYLVNIVLVPTDEAGVIDLKELEKTVRKYGNRLIAVIGSAPSYPMGVMDPIQEMAIIAKNNGCGMHVDCCLGAFIINYLDAYDTRYLALSGVTSLSADTHKNGLAPKGSSVLITKRLQSKNIAYYSIYSLPGWSGGVYGTPKDAGSQSCVQSFNALLAMLGTGKKGYKQIAVAIHEATDRLAQLILQYTGKLKLISTPQVNVVAFQIDKLWGLQKGAIYAFAHEMDKRKITLNTMNDEKVHFCVTARFAHDLNGYHAFQKAIEESLMSVKALNDDLIKTGKKFSGDAGMYCALEAAMTPVRQEMSKQKYFENLLLGQQGAKDAIRAYFLAQLDPFQKSSAFN
jgi:sphinganine-1-phosphate aldolase